MNLGVTGAPAIAPSATASAVTQPYVGLSYYTEELADVFFGREVERTLIISNLRAARLTLLYAPSGVGKSSLLRAGVAAHVKRLARRRLTERGSAQFIPVVFASWRDEPADGVIAELGRAVAPFAADAELKLPRGHLVEAIEVAAAATNANLLVLLDQFEEYFLYGAAESRPGRFADELVDAINRPGLPANFLIAVREDAYAGIGDLLQGKITDPYGNTLGLRHLDREAARQAITKPIDHFNSTNSSEEPIQIEPALVQAVLDQVRAGEVAFEHEGRGVMAPATEASKDRIETPYLQLVMTALWERERAMSSTVLRLETLATLGGAQAIVRSHLDRAMSDLSEAERETAVDVFNHLVTPSGTKIVHTVADLAQYSGRDLVLVQALADKLSSGEQRILRPVPPSPGDSRPRTEIFHDVLAPAIQAWRSAQGKERLRLERQAAMDRAKAERGRARTFRALAVMASVLLAVAILGVVLALVENSRLHSTERRTQSLALATQAVSDLQNGNVSQGVLLSLEAYDSAPTPEALSSVDRAQLVTQSMAGLLTGHRAYVTSVAYSPDGKIIASGGADKLILLQDAVTGRTSRVLQGETTTVEAVAFSSDGKWLAAGSDDGKVMVWDVATGHRLAVLSGHGAVNSVAFAPHSAVLADANSQGTTVLANARTGQRLRVLHVGCSDCEVSGVAFSPDGRSLATTDPDGGVTIWNAITGRRLRTLRGQNNSGSPVCVAFSTDGQLLAVGTTRSLIIWNLITGRMSTRNAGGVNGVAFSPYGSIIATAGLDHQVTLWSTKSNGPLQILSGHTAAVESVAFAPSGKTLISGGDDNQVIIWAALGNEQGHERQRVLPVGSPAYAVAYSPDGRLLASAQADGNVSLWNPDAQRPGLTLHGSGVAETVAFSPTGRTLASGSSDHTVTLWNERTGARERTLKGHTAVVYSVAFSPDGRTLAAGSGDDTTILWNARTGGRERTLRGHTDWVNAVAFSPDSRTVATASEDRTVILWDVRTGRHLRTLTGPLQAVETVSFSPDGLTVTGGSTDGTLTTWNVRTGRIESTLTPGGRIVGLAFSPNGRLLGFSELSPIVTVQDLKSGFVEPLSGHTRGVLGVAFSPDSRTLASAGLDSTVVLTGPLPTSLGFNSVRVRLCGIVRRNLSLADWNHFFRGQAYQRTCPGFPSG